MKKLYAIRDKETGQVYSLDEYLDLHAGEVIEVNSVRPFRSGGKHQIRIEPTEPCEYCRGNAKELVDGDTTIFINHEDKVFYADWGGSDYLAWEYCPMCGRRLT